LSLIKICNQLPGTATVLSQQRNHFSAIDRGKWAGRGRGNLGIDHVRKFTLVEAGDQDSDEL
jgi:hypothetical protein